MTALLLVAVLVALVALSLWAIIDATLQPHQSYEAAGVSQGLVTAMLLLTCAIGAGVYFILIRPRLRRATR